jgi:hypothetical protein
LRLVDKKDFLHAQLDMRVPGRIIFGYSRHDSCIPYIRFTLRIRFQVLLDSLPKGLKGAGELAGSGPHPHIELLLSLSFKMVKFFTTLVALAAVALGVSASPINLQKRISGPPGFNMYVFSSLYA